MGDKDGGLVSKGKPRYEYRGGEIRLDKEGHWYHEGEQITHELTVDLFSRSVRRDPAGGYCLEVGYECAPIAVEDTPFMVRSATLEGGGVRVRLNDKTEEALDLATLRVGADDVLYCDVKNREFPARFLRPAYYQLMRALVETDQGYAVRVGDKLWPIRTANP